MALSSVPPAWRPPPHPLEPQSLPAWLYPGPTPRPSLSDRTASFLPPTHTSASNPDQHTQGCLIFRLLRDLIGWGHEGAATAQRATGLHTQQENRSNKHLLESLLLCACSGTLPAKGPRPQPLFRKPHSFLSPAGDLRDLLAGSWVPAFRAARVRVLLSIPAALSRASCTRRRQEAGVLSPSRTSPVQPLRSPGPNSRR